MFSHDAYTYIIFILVIWLISILEINICPFQIKSSAQGQITYKEWYGIAMAISQHPDNTYHSSQFKCDCYFIKLLKET